MKNYHFFISVSIFVLILTIFPFWWLSKQAGSGVSYTGVSPVAPADGNVYLSAYRQGRAGHLAFENRYNDHIHETVFGVYLFYTVLGAVSKHVSLTTVHVFLLVHIIGALFFLLSLFIATYVFLPKPYRSIGLFFSVLISGMTWAPILIVQLLPPLAVFFLRCGYKCIGSDFWIPESTNILLLWMAPHFVYAVSAQIGALTIFFAQMKQQLQTVPLILFLLLSGIATFAHPYSLVIILAVIGVTSILETIRIRNLRIFLQSLVFIGLLFPLWGYYSLLWFGRPAVSVIQAQVAQTSPPLLVYLVGFGCLLILIGLGIRKRDFHDDRYRFLAQWIFIQSVLVYIPIAPQRRFVMGIFLPLALLAAVGFHHACQRVHRYHFQRVISIILFLGCIDPLLSLSSLVWQYRKISNDWEKTFAYVTHDESDAFAYLETKTKSNTTVLSSERIGNLIPAFANNFVYIGHWGETPDYMMKREKSRLFFAGDASSNFLNSEKISYIWTDTSSPLKIGGTIPVYRNNSMILYQVTESK